MDKVELANLFGRMIIWIQNDGYKNDCAEDLGTQSHFDALMPNNTTQ